MKNKTISSLNQTVNTNEDNVIIDKTVAARFRDENILAKPEQVDYIDVSPQQVVSVTTSCIPFLEHDDATRALMGANMQRQAMPLLKTEAHSLEQVLNISLLKTQEYVLSLKLMVSLTM